MNVNAGIKQAAILAIGIIALGVTQVILTGGIDLSSGSVVGMTAMIENDFDVVVPLAEYGHYATLNDLAKMIAEEQ